MPVEYWLEFSILCWREEAGIKRPGKSSWIILACQIWGGKLHCFSEGEKRKWSLQEYIGPVGLPGLSWLWCWSSNIWYLSIHSCSLKIDFLSCSQRKLKIFPGHKALNLTEWCKLQSQHWQMFHSLIKEKEVWNSDFPIGCLCRAKLHMILIVYSLQIDHRYLISVFDYWQKPFLHWSLCR